MSAHGLTMQAIAALGLFENDDTPYYVVNCAGEKLTLHGGDEFISYFINDSSQEWFGLDEDGRMVRVCRSNEYALDYETAAELEDLLLDFAMDDSEDTDDAWFSTEEEREEYLEEVYANGYDEDEDD